MVGRSSRSRRDLIQLAGGGVLLGTGGASLATALFQVNGDVHAQDQSKGFVRRNVYDFAQNGPELTAYRKGIEVMRKRDPDDPTSWQYQANIHGTSKRPALEAWNSCQHFSWFFLSWHRMYLYWFERIVRKASGYDGFALPYWNYEKAEQSRLPRAFRRPSKPSNPLYTENRREQANAGKKPRESATSSALALESALFISNQTDDGFGGGSEAGTAGLLEQSPHNPMHVWIGGDRGWMSAFETAARDPIFWLHHANIDRLWEVWLQQGGDRENPTEADWLNKKFVFFDEDGNRVNWSVADIAPQLDYEYDSLSGGGSPSAETRPTRSRSDDGALRTLAAKEAVVLTDRRTSVSLPSVGASSPAGTSGAVLVLEDVAAIADVGFVYEVYVGLRDGAKANFRDPAYVGSLSSFGMPVAGSGHAGHGVGRIYRFAIGDEPLDSKPTVTFVPVVSPEREVQGGVAQIGRITIEG